MRRLLSIISLLLLIGHPAQAQGILPSTDTASALQNSRGVTARAYANVLATTLTEALPLVAQADQGALDPSQRLTIRNAARNWILSHESLPDSGAILNGADVQNRNNFFRAGGDAADWGLSLRHCDDRLLAFVPALSLKSGITVQDVMQAANQSALQNGQTGAALRPGVVVQTGAQKSIQFANGGTWAIPPCLDSGYPSPIPLGALAMQTPAADFFETAAQRPLVETRVQQCPSGQIGNVLQQRIGRQAVNSRGIALGAILYDTQTATSEGQWQDVPGGRQCRPARTVAQYYLGSCQDTVDGQIITGKVLLRLWQTEVQNAPLQTPTDDVLGIYQTPITYVVSDENGNPLDGFTQGETIWSQCDNLPSTTIIPEETVDEWQIEYDCARLYPDYPDGTFIRYCTKTSKTWHWVNADALNLDPVTQEVHTVQNDNKCYREYTTNATEETYSHCPSYTEPLQHGSVIWRAYGLKWWADYKDPNLPDKLIQFKNFLNPPDRDINNMSVDTRDDVWLIYWTRCSHVPGFIQDVGKSIAPWRPLIPSREWVMDNFP